jgi:hypothetical protein
VDTNDMLEQLKQQLISEDLAEAEKKWSLVYLKK